MKPPLLCVDCDAPFAVDGDDGACEYTGRGCLPGGCDCGAERTVRCDRCEGITC